jgi:tryptophan 2,3-dioxygenase
VSAPADPHSPDAKTRPTDNDQSGGDGQGPRESEYEKYIRTTPLLALQKPAEALVCHDELAFQIVHQVEELWMKLALHEVAHAVGLIGADRLAEAHATLARACTLVDLMSAQFKVLESLSPRAYFTVRTALGRGSGQESPGFNRLLEEPKALGEAFKAALLRHGRTLLELHRDPAVDPPLFNLAEILIDFDAGFSLFRYRHLSLVKRIIGGRTPSLKGPPAELLEHGVKQTLFPELWLVREALFRDFVPGPSLYGDDTRLPVDGGEAH